MQRGIVIALVACSSPARPPTSVVTKPDDVATGSAAPAAAHTIDRCAAYVEREVAGMSWYIGPYGVLDWVDLVVVARVTREQCATYSDTELACVSKEPVEATSCLSDTQISALRTALDPALDRPKDLSARADAAKDCSGYYAAMRSFEACEAVPATFKKLVTRAWSSTAGVQTPPRACHIGAEVMKQRLAALGCATSSSS